MEPLCRATGKALRGWYATTGAFNSAFVKSLATSVSTRGRLFHGGSWTATDTTETGGASTASSISINPLQQAPAGTTREQRQNDGLTTTTGSASSSGRATPSDATTTMTTTTATTSRYGPQHAHATLRGARISPRKLNQFVDVIRNQHIEDALIQCQIHPKKAARMTGKLLESARANAIHNHGLDGNNLKVDQAWVGKGQYLRRVSIHGRGRSGVMHKNRAHLTVVLKEEAGVARRTQVIKPVWERRADRSPV